MVNWEVLAQWGPAVGLAVVFIICTVYVVWSTHKSVDDANKTVRTIVDRQTVQQEQSHKTLDVAIDRFSVQLEKLENHHDKEYERLTSQIQITQSKLDAIQVKLEAKIDKLETKVDSLTSSLSICETTKAIMRQEFAEKCLACEYRNKG